MSFVIDEKYGADYWATVRCITYEEICRINRTKYHVQSGGWAWGDTVVLAFAKSVQNLSISLPSLTTLDLKDTVIGVEGVRALAELFQSVKLSNLHTVILELTYGGGLDSGVVALAKSFQSGKVDNLQYLHLSGSRSLYPYYRESAVGAAGLLAIAECVQSGHLSNLHTLNLTHTAFGDGGIVALAESFQSGRLCNLWNLDLSETELGDTDVFALAGSFRAGHLSVIENLNLSGNRFGDHGLVALAKSFLSGQVSNLQKLDLSKGCFGDAGLVALAECFLSGHVGNLQELDLSKNRFSGAGLRALAESFQAGHLFNLQALNVSYQYNAEFAWGQGSSSIEEIARTLEAGYMPSLTSLNLYDVKISRAAQLLLVSAYQKNTSLVLDVQCKSLSTGTSKSIARLQQRNKRWVATLRALQGEPNVRGTHGKVFLCGNPGVGKTTLRTTLGKKEGWRSMFHFERKSGKHLEHTRGIEVSHIVSKNFSDNQPLMLALWDLAGQSDYHVLHSAFLPDLAFADGQATFFVVVCSTNYPEGSSSIGGRVRSAEDELLYWLRFISSNSARGGHKDLRRKVLVVLNCFHGDRSGHDPTEWSDFLADCGEKFAAFLTIHPHPFILDAKVAKEVKPLKTELKCQAKEILRRRLMPRICLRVQEASKEWARHNRGYPVLHWPHYSSMLFGLVSEEKLIAATEYLHEAGHLIRFKEGALMEGGLPHVTLLILDPEWFCRRVVGHLLLPESMVLTGETSLRRSMAPDGSLPKNFLQKKLDIPPEKVEEVVAVLLRLGLCYQAHFETDKIFVPALIERDDAPNWPSLTCSMSTEEKAWVMGFSLVLEDSSTTLLPMALFRKLQVELAQDPTIGGRRDCNFISGKSRITFSSEGMVVLVEFNSNPTDSQQDRLDILVKPLIDDSDEFNNASTREKQVHLAHNIVERVTDICRECCLGVELVRKIVKPWNSAHGLLPMPKRDISTSMEDVKARVKENGARTMNWTVGKVLVKEEELLAEGDLGELRLLMEEKRDLMKEVMEGFGLTNFPKVGDDSVQYTKVSPQTRILLQDSERRDRAIHKKLDELSCVVKEVRDSLHEALKQQKTLIRNLQSLERFTIEEAESSVPRFMYLAETGKPSVWMRPKLALTHAFKLHFLCEAPHSDHTLHEVDGQEGVDVSTLQDWAKILGPVLDWSLKISFVAAKIAGSAFLPGLSCLIPDVPPGLLSTKAQAANAIADLLQSSSVDFTSGHSHQPVLDPHAECERHGSSRGRSSLMAYLIPFYHSFTRSKAPESPLNHDREGRGDARAALKEILDGLNSQEFKQQIALRRVRILDGQGGTQHVVWICDSCYGEYGDRVRQI